jgi:hypothetical protein
MSARLKACSKLVNTFARSETKPMGEDIAVVGGGMFGVTAAVDLAEAGHEVTLYERNSDILEAASGSNHWRLHRGYHYPLSDETAKKTLDTEPLFRDRYAKAIIEDEDHYYAIAEDSKVDYAGYVDFMETHGLEYRPVNLDLVNKNRIEQTIRVNENHVSPVRLRELCWNELEQARVATCLDTEVSSLEELAHERVVLATYASSNALLPEGHELRRQYTFEICEVPIIDLPAEYAGNNIIVVYGPFMSTDHWGQTDYFAMGDYHHMRHHSNTGYQPTIPDAYEGLVNTGLVEGAAVSNFDSFKEHGQKFIPGVMNGKHIGSLFTIRTILPDVGETDARPTLVNHAGDIITVFGGKLATSVDTAREVMETAERAWT